MNKYQVVLNYLEDGECWVEDVDADYFYAQGGGLTFYIHGPTIGHDPLATPTAAYAAGNWKSVKLIPEEVDVE